MRRQSESRVVGCFTILVALAIVWALILLGIEQLVR